MGLSPLGADAQGQRARAGWPGVAGRSTGRAVSRRGASPWAGIRSDYAARVARLRGARIQDRLLWVAFARVETNGHAPFGPGELAESLETIDYETGELVRPDQRSVKRAVQQAKASGTLAESSNTRCLVLPSDAHEPGTGTKWNRRDSRWFACPHHGARG